MRNLVIALALMLSALPADAAPPPKVVPAADGIFEAFKSHSLVGLGEWHGLAQELDFYAALVRDPRFAAEVGNIVLETGGEAQQALVDRYVGGEDIPYSQLRKIWTDVVGWSPTVTAMGSVNLFAAIRAANAGLPPEKRIKVWMGEPMIDWTKIQTKDDWSPLVKQRDTHPAELIKREILAKKKKALVIYGSGHLHVYPGYDSLRAKIAAADPHAWYIVMPYVGYFQPACVRRFEPFLRNWPVPALASPVNGSSLGQRILRPGCTPFDPKGVPADGIAKSNPNNYGLTADALLYLGPRDRLSKSPSMPDLYLDTEFRSELDRRSRIINDAPLTGFTVDRNPAAGRPFD